MVHEERHHLTPKVKHFVEMKLAQGLSPEKIKQLYADEIPVSARMLRYYIDQGLIQKRLHKADAIVNKNNGVVEIKPVHRINPEMITFGHWLVYVKHETPVYQRVATLVLVEERTTNVVLVRIEDTTVQDIYTGLVIFLSHYADAVKSLDLLDDWYLDREKRQLLVKDYDLIVYQAQQLAGQYLNRLKAVEELLPDYVDMIKLTQHEMDVLASILNECPINDNINSGTVADVFEKELWANGKTLNF
ncbi:IS30 family transposase [Weissella uvarum]|uniref:MerR family transcriptional regulator n=1 Tax=Weissella uvarum TaxID=1479233 RepID=UPI001960BE2F|nr:hypothetical protein [Weissella uvarum]MBM7617402.1 IS30 family transposase [Weissella uvarum]MCM0595713.1 hypothetical protein [Weissella uvarum]